MHVYHTTGGCGEASHEKLPVEVVRMTNMRVQDTRFINVRASNVLYKSRFPDDALVIADGLTYSNVTTDTLQWDTAGNLMGSGDEDEIVLEFPDTVTSPNDPDDPLDFDADRVRSLDLEDPWFVAVKEV